MTNLSNNPPRAKSQQISRPERMAQVAAVFQRDQQLDCNAVCAKLGLKESAIRTYLRDLCGLGVLAVAESIPSAGNGGRHFYYLLTGTAAPTRKIPAHPELHARFFERVA